jgi:hypothetical protein
MKKGLSMLVSLLALLFVSCSTNTVDSRDQFTGTYNATNSIYKQDSLHIYSQDSLQLLNKYILKISIPSDDSKEIILSNFAGDSITIDAVVSGNTFTIVQDTINKNIYSGTGTISKSNISINFWIKSIQNNGYTNYIDAAVKN